MSIGPLGSFGPGFGPTFRYRHRLTDPSDEELLKCAADMIRADNRASNIASKQAAADAARILQGNQALYSSAPTLLQKDANAVPFLLRHITRLSSVKKNVLPRATPTLYKQFIAPRTTGQVMQRPPTSILAMLTSHARARQSGQIRRNRSNTERGEFFPRYRCCLALSQGIEGIMLKRCHKASTSSLRDSSLTRPNTGHPRKSQGLDWTRANGAYSSRVPSSAEACLQVRSHTSLHWFLASLTRFSDVLHVFSRTECL